MKKMLVILLLNVTLWAMDKPPLTALPILPEPANPVHENELPVAQPLVKANNLLTDALCADIQRKCTSATDSFKVLQEIDKQLMDVRGSSDDTLLYYRLLYIKAFAKHVDSVLSKIREYRDDLTPKSLQHYMQVLDMLIFSKFSKKMALFLKELYVKKHEAIDALTPNVYSCARRLERKIYFLSNTSFLVGFSPNAMNNEQSILFFQRRDSTNWQSSTINMSGRSLPPAPAEGCAGIDLSNRVFKYHKGKTIAGTLFPVDFEFPGLEIFREVDNPSSPSVTWMPLPEFRSRHTKTSETFKFSHMGDKLAFVYLGITNDGLLKIECYVSTLNYEDAEQQKYLKYTKIEPLKYAQKNKLPQVSIIFSHNDESICLLVNGLYCALLDLVLITDPPKKIPGDQITAAAFTHDDSCLVVTTASHKLHCYDPKGFTKKWPDKIVGGENDKPVSYLKFSPDDTLLVAIRDDANVDTSVTILTNRSKERSFENVLTEIADKNGSYSAPPSPSVPKASPEQSASAKERMRQTYSSINTKLEVRRIQFEEELQKEEERRKQFKEQQQKALEDIPLPIAADGHPKITHMTMRENLNGAYIRCLALEGTGSQVLFTLYLLEKIAAQSKKRWHELFDCVVGSSSAAVVACALAASKSDHEPLEQPRQICANLISSFAQLFKQKKYEKSALQALCKKLLGDALFKNALKRVLVPYEEVSITSVGDRQIQRPTHEVFDSQEAITSQNLKVKLREMADVAFYGSLDDELFPGQEEKSENSKFLRAAPASRRQADEVVEIKIAKESMHIEEKERTKIIMLHITPTPTKKTKSDLVYQYYKCLTPISDLVTLEDYKREVDAIVEKDFSTVMATLLNH